jgi:hypothetical protein
MQKAVAVPQYKLPQRPCCFRQRSEVETTRSPVFNALFKESASIIQALFLKRGKGRDISKPLKSFIVNSPLAGGGAIKRRPCQQACGIKRRQRRIKIVYNQRNFGTTKNDGIAILFFEAINNQLKVSR